ncbi:hypothetical protein N9Y83_00850 [Flavobacteriaceae bacterium]|nr:hypothetical protein [Flavobacteriaceae bacterium]
MKNKTTVFSTKGLVEVMITHADITIDYKTGKLQLNKHNPAVSSHYGNNDLITLDDRKAKTILNSLLNQFNEESVLLYSAEDYGTDKIHLLDGNKQIDLKINYNDGSKLSEISTGTMRLIVYEILENNNVELIAELPEAINYNNIERIELKGENYNGALDLYSFSGANINFEEEKINVCFESKSFGPVVDKMILILTNESDAFIDATKTGFEEEFAIDLKYALELITKDGRNA